jgi:hypothetical protein
VKVEKFIRAENVMGASQCLRAGMVSLGLWTINIPSPGFLKLVLVVFIIRAVVLDQNHDVVP